jgi:hypothetical protein
MSIAKNTNMIFMFIFFYSVKKSWDRVVIVFVCHGFYVQMWLKIIVSDADRNENVVGGFYKYHISLRE